jgi:hypothetical protein
MAHLTRDRVVNPACRSLLLLFRGQPLTPPGAAPDAGNNASLLLTKILNSVKRKSLILKDLIEPLSLNSLFSQGGTPWTPPSLRWLFPYLKAYKITATSCIKTHLRLRGRLSKDPEYSGSRDIPFSRSPDSI